MLKRLRDSSDDAGSSVSNNSDDYQCTVCETTGGDWIGCDGCDKWHHPNCVSVSSPDDIDEWFYADCED